MQYIVCQEPGRFEFHTKERPILKNGEVLLKINQVGICGTDLHAYKGNQPFFSYPRILGHELAGTIVDPNGQSDWSVNDRVAIIPYLHCGDCVACRSGKTNCCQSLEVLGVHVDGGMQEYFSIDAKYLIKANDLDEASIAIVEPLSIGAHAVRRANIKPGENVVVVGAGPIGLGIMRFVQLKGGRVIAIDVNESRLTYAKNTMKVADEIVVAGPEAIDQVFELTNEEGATAILDATGNQKALNGGVNYLAHGGRYILVGLLKGDLTFYHPFIHAREASILCSRNATREDFEYVLSVLKMGDFPISEYITHRVHYSELLNHFESYYDPEMGVIKAMIDWN